MRTRTRSRRTAGTTYTAAKTATVTAEAKAVAGVANGESLRERRARRNAEKKTVYNANLSQTVVSQTGVKGGAAATAKEVVADVTSTYKTSGKLFAKIAVADKAIKELTSLLPQSKAKKLAKKIPVLGGYITNREEEVVKGLLVTALPVALTAAADYVESHKVANVLFDASDILVNIGARDGIEGITEYISPKWKDIFTAFTEEVEQTTSES